MEAEPEAPAGVAAFMTRTAVWIGLHAAHAVPGAGGLADIVDAAALAEQADRLRVFLGKKFRHHKDVRMLLSPLDTLNPAFVRDLDRVGRRRPLVLFFDTGPLLDGWLRSVRDGVYGDRPKDVVVTVAGRHPLDPGDWAPYGAVLPDVPLPPFSDAEARQLLAGKGVTGHGRTGSSGHPEVSGRLRLLVATLAENQPTDPDAVGDPQRRGSRTIPEVGSPDPTRRALAIAAGRGRTSAGGRGAGVPVVRPGDVANGSRDPALLQARPAHCCIHSVRKAAQSMYDTPDTQSLGSAPKVTAPDGSAVRPLCQITGLGSCAHFQLEPGEIAKAVSHATVQEIWYIIGGTGQMWRRQDGQQETVVDLRPGTCLTIPLRTAFQFRADSTGDPLRVIAITLPPWPLDSEHEARPEQGPWTTTFRH